MKLMNYEKLIDIDDIRGS
jgi:hypothetical protein